MDQRQKHGWKRKHSDHGDSRDANIFSEAPREIKIVDFAESRAAEIDALTKCCETLSGSKRVFQTLPRHMRRRAMSHNIKRIPKRLREVVLAENMKQHYKTVPSKRPSRRHRRRPKNLLAEYNRRKRNHVWLETHIWHAKRFKMAEKWGYKLPVHPNDKSSRAAYRAADRHCLLQDQSYLCCVEVTGPEGEILNGLRHVTSQKTGRTFAAKFSLDGSREGRTMIYAYDQYPYNAIGCVDFLWKPVDQSNSSSGISSTNPRQLWIWCHCSCYSQVWDELCKTFTAAKIDRKPQLSSAAELEHVENNDACMMQVETDDQKTKIKHKKSEDTDVALTQRNLEKCDNQSKLKNSSSQHATDNEETVLKGLRASNGSVILTSLKDSLVRYRLWGPLSQPVLADLFKAPSVNPSNDSTNQWWTEHYGNENEAKIHEKQWETWNTMKSARSPAELSPHCILALTVRDPRLFLPPKKTKVMDNMADKIRNTIPPGSSLSATSPETTSSPLWQQVVREAVQSTKISEQEMNRKRVQLLTPGSQLRLGDEESRVPVLLIQRPGKQKCLTDSKKQTGADSLKQTATDSLKQMDTDSLKQTATILMKQTARDLMKQTTKNSQTTKNPLKQMTKNSLKQTGKEFMKQTGTISSKQMNWSKFNRVNQSNVTLGFGSGWDIILPSGWGMAFWISLVYRGARVGGTREAESVAREQGDLHFPLDYPDTQACKTEQQLVRTNLVNKHGRFPPAKRPNFVKLGTEAPFHCPWEELVTAWDKWADSNFQDASTIRDNSSSLMDQSMNLDGKSSFYVLRGKEELGDLKLALQTARKISDVSTESEGSSVLTLSRKLAQTLVPVRISMHKRGTPSQFAMICLPEPQDQKIRLEDTEYGGPMEPLHIVGDEEKLSKLKLKKKRRKKSGNSSQKKCATMNTTEVTNSHEFPINNLISSASRQVIGFVNHGAFSLAQGFGSGLGFCTAVGLLRLATINNPSQDGLKSLVRSANSSQYRFARLTLIE